MTDIREPNFQIDLPGEWEPAESLEEGAFMYRDTRSKDTLLVMLLGVKPVYALADERMLLEQYMEHRQQFEKGKNESLQQSAPEAHEAGEAVEGEWEAHDPASGRRVRHRIMLRGGLLADFRYVSFDLAEDAFAEQAAAILATAGISAD